jgi:hypothetical protein
MHFKTNKTGLDQFQGLHREDIFCFIVKFILERYNKKGKGLVHSTGIQKYEIE